MKNIIILIFSITITFSVQLIAGHGEHQKHSNHKEIHAQNRQTILVEVQGMVCDFCARGLEKVFYKQDAVENVIVSLSMGTVTILLHPNKNLTDEQIKELIRSNGISPLKIKRS